MEQIALEWDSGPQVFTVAEFTGALRELIDREFGTVWISGEISGCKLAASGHFYFTLKDGEAQLKAVCYRGTARYLKYKPRDGVAVIARGRLDVYAGRGEYQLIVEMLEPQGYGALQFAFEQLKKKLTMEGLFEASRKRALPKLPARIGLVTSPGGAVIQDMLNILSRRFPGLHIRLYPAQVQGEGSVEAVCRGIEYFSRVPWAQVLIVARGGGSLEDLWTFNEERVARAIAACTIPVVSAIGHETDFTIADFVADLRAPTPSAAAELVVCTREQLSESIRGCQRKLVQSLRYTVIQAGRRLDQLSIARGAAVMHRAIGRRAQRVDELDYQARARIRKVMETRRARWRELDARLRRQDVRLRFARSRRRVDAAQSSIEQCIAVRMSQARQRLSLAVAHLTQLSPLKILDRGYALVHTSDGTLVKSGVDAPAGTQVGIRLAQGRLEAEVTRATPDGSSELPS